MRTAFEYGPFCPQVYSSLSAVFFDLTALQASDADNGHILYAADDCLQLNMYSPVATGGASQITAPRLSVVFFSVEICR